MAAGDFAFGSRNLVDPANGVICESMIVPPAPKELAIFRRASLEGSVIADERFPDKLIMASGVLIGPDAATAEARLDAFLKDLYDGEKDLKVGYQDERSYKARLDGEPTVEKQSLILYTWEVAFRARLGVATALNESTATNNNALTLETGQIYSKVMALTPGGSIYARPVYTLTIPGAGPYGISYIKVLNQDTGWLCLVARTYAANDVLVIDTAGKTPVTVNGSPVNFAGSLPVIDPVLGVNDIEIECQATAVPTINVTITWRARWSR